MKITLEVDMSEAGDRREAVLLLQSLDFELSIVQYLEEMRQAAKHGDDEVAAKWRERLYLILDQNNIRVE